MEVSRREKQLVVIEEFARLGHPFGGGVGEGEHILLDSLTSPEPGECEPIATKSVLS